MATLDEPKGPDNVCSWCKGVGRHNFLCAKKNVNPFCEHGKIFEMCWESHLPAKPTYLTYILGGLSNWKALVDDLGRPPETRKHPEQPPPLDAQLTDLLETVWAEQEDWDREEWGWPRGTYLRNPKE